MNNRRIKSANTLLAVLLWCLSTTEGYGQRIKYFSVDKELSSSLISQVYQDRSGIIWIATEDGLNRYDGAKFTVFRHQATDENSLADNNVLALFEDKKGTFFVGTARGLQTYDAAAGKFSKVPIAGSGSADLPANVRVIMQRKDGTLLIGTSGFDGIYAVQERDGKLMAVNANVPVPEPYIWTIFEDAQGDLWVSTESNGLFRIHGKQIAKRYFDNRDMAWNTISSLCMDSRQQLYAGSVGRGLFVYNKQTDSFEPIAYPQQPNLSVKALYNAGADELYIGTDGSGVKVLNTARRTMGECDFNITQFDFDKSKVHAILKDRTGNIWLGFFQKGVMMLPGNAYPFHYMGNKSRTNNLIGSNDITAVFEGHDGVLWVGTDNDGIYKIQDNKKLAHFEHNNTPAAVPSTVMGIFEDSNHTLWLGSYLGGMVKMNPQTGACERVSKLVDEKSTPVPHVYCFAEDSQKRLWIGTMGAGIFYMDLRTNEIVNLNVGRGKTSAGNAIGNKWVNCLHISADNKLYIGTCNGVSYLNLGTLAYNEKVTAATLPYPIIYTIFEDGRHDIWLGTSSEGLVKMDARTMKTVHFTTKDGLPSNSICAIESDDHNQLWLSTNYGLCKFNPTNHTCQNYYANDGLQGNEFSKNASLRDDKGNLYFAGLNGITYFNPRDIGQPTNETDVYLSDFYIFNTPVRKGMKSDTYDILDTTLMAAKVLNLCYKDNSFTLEFSNLAYNNAEHLTYLYSVNGSEWTKLQAGTNRVSFSNMAAGTYVFRYRAENFGTQSATKSITIVIHPAWYASAWAKFIYALLALAVVGYVIWHLRRRYKVRQEMLEHIHAEQVNEAKLQFFINISHEIRTPMSLIIAPLQKLIATDKDDGRQKSYHLMYRSSQRILRLINQLMDIRKIDKGKMVMHFREANLVEVIGNLHEVFMYLTKSKNIAFTFHHEAEAVEAWIDTQNFDKIIVNLLSNAIKFTPSGGQIDIGLRTTETGMAEITVSDNGPAIDEGEMNHIFERFYQINDKTNTSAGGTGIGLHLTRSLVELHHGSISVANNAEGGGCRFIVNIPLGCAHLKPEEMAEADNAAEPMEIFEPALRTETAEEPVDEQKVQAKSKHRVLVVEDDEEIRRYLRDELAADCHVLECANGKEALATALERKPDLVISDVMMPEMDGLTLCRKIKQNVNINHIPVILLTAKTREADNLEGLGVGADAYITKPFNIEVLRRTAANLMKSREVLRNCYTGSQEQAERQPVLEVDLQPSDSKLLDRVMSVINRNLGNPELSVEMIASEVGISRVHLHRKMKELTNQSTRDLVRNIRLKQAAQLLQQKQYNVSEVAMLTGFSSITIFSRAFKELYGVSPTGYAAKEEQGDEEKS